MEASIDANIEKYEVLRCTLVWMDIQARTVSTQEEMKSKMDREQEKMEAAIPSIRSMLEETIKSLVEDILSCLPKEAGLLPGSDRGD
jgi:hypothetical protein